MRASVLGLLVLTPPCGASDPRPSGETPPRVTLRSGLYEAWSPVSGAPVGPLTEAPTGWPRWLRVEADGAHATVTFEPDERVVWDVELGPYGVVRKDTRVDGQRWTRSTFGYDRDGLLATKEVQGPGAERHLSVYERGDGWTERAEDGGRGVTFRSDPNGTLMETWTLDSDGERIVGRTDRFDRAGNLLSTQWGEEMHGSFGGLPPGTPELYLLYRRDPDGRLIGLDRSNAATRRPMLPLAHLIPWDARGWLVADAPIERHEQWLLAGLPATRSDEGRGPDRKIRDQWADRDCWLNETSGMDYDPTGLARSAFAGCICGFCVAGDAAAADAYGEDLHFTAGPWYRLDGAVDVTGDHEIAGVAGPIRVDALRPGDPVLGDDGRIRRVRSVERLPDGERLGRNLRTASGTFAAGGFRFVSEAPRTCP